MKKPTNPSKVIIAPNPPKPKGQEECVPESTPVTAPDQAPVEAPPQQQTEAEGEDEEMK